jgi:L-cysteine S-thiosulfotransferase
MPRLLGWLLLLGAALVGRALAEIPPGEKRSGFEFMSRETQAMQSDDTGNPGMLWVLDGERLWQEPQGAAGKSCASCHGDATKNMRGVAARYPAWDATSRRPIDLTGRVNACRATKQVVRPFALESQELLSLVAYVGYQSRGVRITAVTDSRLAPFRENGRRFFERRMGQLQLSCATCHDDLWGQRLGGNLIPQAHPSGYPLYRLEWQTLGSLQRRIRNCLTGVRAEPFAFGAPEMIDLELYLKHRAAGLPVETPAVRP